MAFDGQTYSGGTDGGTPTRNQLRTDNFVKQALIEVKKDQYFGPLADVTAMPKNMGKKIKRYHYVPLLDDANINDQGIDANGAILASGQSGGATATITVTHTSGAVPQLGAYASSNVKVEGNKTYFVFTAPFATDYATTVAAAKAGVILEVNTWCGQLAVAGGLGLSLVGVSEVLKFTDAVNATDGLAYVLGYRFWNNAGVAIVAEGGVTAAATMVTAGGNFYGSSKDVGTITGKFPALTETGGRVNRVGFTRVELEGTFKKYGFFDEYTQESLDFDSDSELEMHINREMIFGANEIVEDLLQLDLLNSAGVVYYAGAATSASGLTGAGTATEVTYSDLSRLSVELDNNRCPKTTKVISGSRMVDTRVVRAGRVMYIGSELTLTVEKMEDHFKNQAFISVAHYADAGSVLNGEIGTVGQFRLVVVPEMMHWAGAGASEGTNLGYRATGGKYDVFPMLVIGDGAFTTIGFQTSGSNSKFTIKHSKPGSPESYANDPYGETGFMSIKWYYGFMTLRPERIALLKTVARI